MATAKPLQAWAMEQAEARRKEEQPNTAEILAPALASIPKPREDRLPQLHDWQRSADRGAEFAQRAELRRRDFEMREKAQDRRQEQQQNNLRLQAELRAKYRPRGAGGQGPVSKLTQEYLKIWQSDPPKDEQQAYARRQRMEMIRTKLDRLGASGRSAVSDFAAAQLTPDKYRIDASKRAYEEQSNKEQAELKREEMRLRADQEAAKAEAQARLRLVPKRDPLETPESAKERQLRQKDLEDAIERLRKTGGKQVSFGGKSYMQMPDGNFLELEA